MQAIIIFIRYFIMIYSNCYFFIWFGVHLTLINVIAITDADVVTLETLSSTTEDLIGLENNMSIHTVKKREWRGWAQWDSPFCYTPECIEEVLKMDKNMFYRLQPCDDFYQFACDRFIKNAVIPEGRKYVDVYSIFYDNHLKQLRTVMEKESSENETRSHRLAKDFYKACVKENVSEEYGIGPLLDKLHELGGWPILEGDRWNESNFHWLDSISKFRKLGFSMNYFINFEVINYQTTKTLRNRLYLSPPTFGLPRENLVKLLHIKEYHEYMADVAMLLGVGRHSARYELDAAMQFEIDLALVLNKSEEMLDENETYEITVYGLGSFYDSSIQWLQELNNILAPQVQLEEDDIIVEKVPFYLTDMAEFINKTPKKVQANYVFWRAINEAADYLDDFDIIRRRKLEFLKEIKQKEEEPKWRKCVRQVSDHLDFSVSSMEYQYNQDVEKTVVEMVENVKSGFKQIFDEVKWMEEKTLAKALKKLDDLRSFIFYPNKFVNITRLDRFYKDLELNADNPLGNKLNITIFETNRMFRLLNETPKNEWWRPYLKPTKLNAMSILRRNSIGKYKYKTLEAIPLARLQDPFFNITRPNYMNYAALGSTIGHEIAHGFNDHGSHFYKKGKKINWWEIESLNNYKVVIQCIIDHYGKYRNEDAGMNLDGEKTLNENSADVGGLRAAYYAYKKWVGENGSEKSLPIPGRLYTPAQLFWISYAQTWCGKYEKNAMKILMRDRTHSPAEYRVNGLLSSLDIFQRDFNCGTGSKMNPSYYDQCILW